MQVGFSTPCLPPGASISMGVDIPMWRSKWMFSRFTQHRILAAPSSWALSFKSFGFNQWWIDSYDNMLNPYLKLHPYNKNRSGQLQVWVGERTSPLTHEQEPMAMGQSLGLGMVHWLWPRWLCVHWLQAVGRRVTGTCCGGMLALYYMERILLICLDNWKVSITEEDTDVCLMGLKRRHHQKST